MIHRLLGLGVFASLVCATGFARAETLMPRNHLPYPVLGISPDLLSPPRSTVPGGSLMVIPRSIPYHLQQPQTTCVETTYGFNCF